MSFFTRLRGNRVKKGEGCGVVDCWLDKIEIFSALYGSLRYYEKKSFLYPKNQVPVLHYVNIYLWEFYQNAPLKLRNYQNSLAPHKLKFLSVFTI